MGKTKDVFVCKDMKEAIDKQLELAKQGIDSSSYQTITNYVVVVVKEAENDSN